ncbi:[acyl-carrier-protein] S-malonyltransferase [Thalassotalea euphylliae]|uniref:Malonyl CoA-acyl carrier protein transacylase n=1 Tax=Thalassotalea euphylliae TaxID=1655234 RepID=A0A3E0TS86_9GAMM|nr:ACP S-malonyltransferase [Thalassotalea euphylliae]REL27187.1 [acyl-carrier-protein] S-malonyltransferase [Thalassotalea euphylliae]
MQNILAFVFPGQGSQAVGMLSDFADHEVVQATFKEASDALGYDVWQLVAQGPAEQLNSTNYTQPALLTSSVALWRVLQAESDLSPAYLAGHSLGEYSALVCAGVLSLADAVTLVEKRGEFMQAAVPDGVGAMAAVIGLADDAIVDACQQAAQDQVVSAVNFNSPGQVVIAGNSEAVARASELCKEAGAKRVLPLPVSVPSHCALMKPAAEQLAKVLEEITFNEPSIPVVNNVDVALESSGEAIKDALIRQLYSPVRWTESVAFLASQNVENLLEVGPGKVLQGLTKRINKALTCTAVNDNDTLAKAKSL